jgi:tripartite-type tricarboxylate transporter receptor subunit TctC
MRKKIVLFSMVLLLVLLPFLTHYAAAKPFYEGKTMKLIVTTRPGGGYDFYGRLMARFMQKHLPGSTIIVKNVPGAGHIIGTNELYHTKEDGLTFGTFNRAIPFTQVAGLKGVKFDVSKMSWLGSATTEIYSFIVTKKFKTLQDLMKADKVILATGGAGSIAHVSGSLFSQMAGLKNIKNVAGYHGGEGELAMMRGEVDGQFASWNSLRSFVEDGHGHPVMFLAKKQPPGYENIPLLQDVIPEKKHKPVVDLLLTVNLLGRPFAGPPGIPKDRLKALQNAFTKACLDPELLKVAKKAKKPIEYTSGDEALSLVRSIMDLSPEVLKAIKEAYGVK